MAEWGEVKRIVERKVMNERGELGTAYHVDAVTKGGIIFSADIPEDQTDAETVDRILGEKAAKLDALLSL